MARYLYDYLPSIFSIFLILISSLSSGYLQTLVDGMGNSDILDENSEKREKQLKLLRYTALDWATRIGFINSVLAAGVSWFVLFSAAQNPSLGVIEIVTGALLLMVFVIGLFLILRTPAPYLIAYMSTQLGKWPVPVSPTWLLDFALVGVNLVLVAGIFFDQISGS